MVSLSFPMVERTLFRVIGRMPYKLTVKGNTVIDIDPPGEISPLYQREDYRKEKAPLKRVTPFVSEERMLW